MSLPPWSYSFLRDLSNCPHKAYRKFVKRDLPKETSPELEEGVRVHEALELYINNGGFRHLPPELEAHAKPLLGKGTQAEVKLGMTRDMLAADFFQGEPWGRGKADVLILKPPQAMIVDWKTGKVREDDRELRQLALLVRANHPEINQISGCYVWLKEGKMGKLYDLTDINQVYHGTVASMERAQSYEEAGDWPKIPNPLCGWCPVADCENWRPRRAV